MKKIVLSLMFMIVSLGLFGGITVHSATFYGSSGPSDTSIATGEQCTVAFNYSAESITAPVQVNQSLVVSNNGGASHYTGVTVSSFSGLEGDNIDASVTFTMPLLTGDASEDQNLEFVIQLKDSTPLFTVTSNAKFTSTGSTYLDNTLPVELSSFDAVLLSTNDGVKLDWVVESESGVSGYYIYRNTLNDLESAIQIPAFIPSLNVEQQHTYSFTDYEIENNTQYFYWLKSLDLSNEFEFFGPVLVTIGSTNGDNDTPDYFYGTDLYANYPNPFNPTTTISYSVDNPQHVNISVYNVKGQLVKVLLDQQVTDAKVKHSVNWNGTDSNRNKVSSGIYFTVMKARDDVKTNKMVLSK